MAVTPCVSVAPVLGIVTFVPTDFVAAYPEFAGFSSGGAPGVAPLLAQAFALACVILNNTCCSRVRDANTRDTLLQMLTAHITFLLYGTNDGAVPPNITPPPGIIGHIDTAAEGSVSVAASFGGDGGPTQDWYTSSKYGALYWLMTAAYRTALYIPAPARGGFFGGGGYGGYGPGCGC